MKITLDESYIFEGAVYGPGAIDVKDDRIAKALTDAMKRLQGLRDRGPIIKPNGIMTGILPGSETSQAPNGFTPEDLRNQREASDKAVADAAKAESAAKDDAPAAKKQTS